MKKKILAAALAMTMMLGSSVGALAAINSADENGVFGQDVTADSTVNVPTMEIEVPTSLAFTLNPYEMEYTPSGGTAATDQIVGVEQNIVNKSDVGIAVNIMDLGIDKDATGTDTELTLLAAAPTAAIKTKSAFLYLELKAADAEYQAYKPTNKTQLAVPVTKTVSKTDMIILDDKTGDVTTANLKVCGSVVANPTKAWTQDDKVALSFKLTFTPQVNKPTA